MEICDIYIYIYTHTHTQSKTIYKAYSCEVKVVYALFHALTICLKTKIFTYKLFAYKSYILLQAL